MLDQDPVKTAPAFPPEYKPNSEMDRPLSWLKTLDQHAQYIQSFPPDPSDSDSQAILSMSFLGKLGLFGNQLFQYAFLRICAEKTGAKVECPPWIGQVLFGHNDRPVSHRFPPAIEYREIGKNRQIGESFFDFIPEFIPYLENLTEARSSRVSSKDLDSGLANVDLWGFFQFHTRFLKPYQQYFRSLFKPVSDLEAALTKGLNLLRTRGKTVVGVHVRRCEYLTFPQARNTLPIPSEWYCEWLESIWHQLENPVLLLCSDDIRSTLPKFAKFKPITTRDLKIDLPRQLQHFDLDFYVDFFMLSNCDVVATSNSTFSFVACMLNERGKLFFRPHWDFSTKFVSFDPWNSTPLLFMRDEGAKYTKNFVDMAYTTYKTQGFIGMLKSIFLYAPISHLKFLGLRIYLAYKTKVFTLCANRHPVV